MRILAVMPQSLARILVHTVFFTKDRRPLLQVGLATVKEKTDATLSGKWRLPVRIIGLFGHLRIGICFCAPARTERCAGDQVAQGGGFVAWRRTDLAAVMPETTHHPELP